MAQEVDQLPSKYKSWVQTSTALPPPKKDHWNFKFIKKRKLHDIVYFPSYKKELKLIKKFSHFPTKERWEIGRVTQLSMWMDLCLYDPVVGGLRSWECLWKKISQSWQVFYLFLGKEKSGLVLSIYSLCYIFLFNFLFFKLFIHLFICVFIVRAISPHCLCYSFWEMVSLDFSFHLKSEWKHMIMF
jgi:hypothetical protein